MKQSDLQNSSETEKKEPYSVLFKIIGRTLYFAWKNEKLLFIIQFILSVLSAVFVYFQLISFSTIVNEIIRIKTLGLGITHELIKSSIFLGVSLFVPSLLTNLTSLTDTILRTKNGTSLNLYQIDIYSSLDIGTFESSEFQKKKDRASKWGLGSLNNVIYWWMRMVGGITGFITGGIVLYNIHPYLVILALLGAIPYYFIEQTYGKKIFNLTWVSTDETRIEQDRMGYFRNPKSIVEVILFDITSILKKQVHEIATSYDAKLISLNRKESLITTFADVFQALCLFSVIALVTYETLQGNLLIGSLVLGFAAYRSFLSTTQSFFTNYARLTEQARYAKYWFDIFDIKPKIVNSTHAVTKTWTKTPKIEFRDVSFSYPETDVIVLKHISFSIDPGQKIALVGLNGAGKTTIIKLLSRVYDPTEGEILVDGINLKEIDIASWRKHLGILFQDFTNYNFTVREAIAISNAKEPINDAKVYSAATLAGADEFIQTLPKKYNQLLWKGFQDGVELSKGQFQRMAVARIFYRDALISVLDEPTSAIDAVAEEKIFEVLETKMEGKTVVLISHRFSTVKNADKIAVIEHGELKELGSHKQLMKKNGRYAELYNMQASRYLEEK